MLWRAVRVVGMSDDVAGSVVALLGWLVGWLVGWLAGWSVG